MLLIQKIMKLERITLFVLMAFLATSLSQDSWETYEDSEEYYEYEEPIDMEIAKEYFCSELKEKFKSCCFVLYGNRFDAFESCFEKIGLNSKNFYDAVDEACLPETPADVGQKFQDCKNEIQEEMKARNELPERNVIDLTNDTLLYNEFVKNCLPVHQTLMDEGWLQYFMA
ncbi:unnamed protein product [Larinioides sclopetarius]|uniref:Uncharacterized protein n=1 Tax=Larinioides sclopetarius TaxID=280406 RepID=A0AAV2B838_9ARAC